MKERFSQIPEINDGSPTDRDDITDDVVACLEGMSKDELIALIKRVSGAMWGVGLLTKDQKYQAMLDKAAIMALTTNDVNEFVKSSTQWMERTQGKVADRVEQTIRQSVVISVDERRKAASEEADKMLLLLSSRDHNNNVVQ